MTNNLAIVVFGVVLILTTVAALLGRKHEEALPRESLSSQKLSKWLLGLSAGATANSGFVVTAAVGLGYSEGARWLLLPAAWLAGDLLFWQLFPHRINAEARAVRAQTVSDLAISAVPMAEGRTLKRLIGAVTVVCLGGYLSAQWLSGEKFIVGAFDIARLPAFIMFALSIVAYTAIGGFRGSVYADVLQAIVRVVGTAIALVALFVIASRKEETFRRELASAGVDFLRLVPADGGWLALLSAVGFAAAALGFGLGQPQIVSRYMAGASPAETRSAWWIYFLFVQGTWIAMTVFGIGLRGVMPELADPEMGLSVFHRENTGPIITGLIAADIFATIAATANSILVAIAQSIQSDLLPSDATNARKHQSLWRSIVLVGAVTILLSYYVRGSVKTLALSSVGLMGAGIAPVMIVILLRWRHDARSLVAAVVCGFVAAAMWLAIGWSATMSEAGPGIAVGLLANAVFVRALPSRKS